MCFLGTPLLHWYLGEKREKGKLKRGEGYKVQKKVQKFSDQCAADFWRKDL